MARKGKGSASSHSSAQTRNGSEGGLNNRFQVLPRVSLDEGSLSEMVLPPPADVHPSAGVIPRRGLLIIQESNRAMHESLQTNGTVPPVSGQGEMAASSSTTTESVNPQPASWSQVVSGNKLRKVPLLPLFLQWWLMVNLWLNCKSPLWIDCLKCGLRLCCGGNSFYWCCIAFC